MSKRTETTKTTSRDGTVTTTTTTYDEHGRVVSQSISTAAGPGAVVGIQAGTVSGATVIINGKRR